MWHSVEHAVFAGPHLAPCVLDLGGVAAGCAHLLVVLSVGGQRLRRSARHGCRRAQRRRARDERAPAQGPLFAQPLLLALPRDPPRSQASQESDTAFSAHRFRACERGAIKRARSEHAGQKDD